MRLKCSYFNCIVVLCTVVPLKSGTVTSSNYKSMLVAFNNVFHYLINLNGVCSISLLLVYEVDKRGVFTISINT